MKLLVAILRELLGLFIDDGMLALVLVAVVAAAAFVAWAIPALPMVAGAVLLFGCLGALIASVSAETSRSRRDIE
jgi:MFS-type transporter involved in bile tolerance (Atg22 family)